jgi:hypothetical protein
MVVGGFAPGTGVPSPLVEEALEAASVEVLADIEIASTVHRDRMRHVERAAK